MYYVLLVLLVVVLFFIFYILIPHCIKKAMQHSFAKSVHQTPFVYLTFDDGPDPITTPKIISLLNKHNIKATFFMIGKKIEQHPEMVQQMIDDGHSIGHHSYQHTHAWKTGPLQTYLDLTNGHQIIQNLVSDKEILFRPPFGKLNLISLFYILFWKKKTMLWTLDPKDFQHSSSQDIANAVNNQIVPGSVVLLHDGRGNNHQSQILLEAMEMILHAIQQKSLKCATMHQYIEFTYNN